MFNDLLIAFILFLLFICIVKYKYNKLDNFTNNEQNEYILRRSNTFGDDFYLTRNYKKENKIVLDKNINYRMPEPTTDIKFENKETIANKFLDEQNNGAFMNTWYPNRWIDSFDENGVPIFKTRDDAYDIKTPQATNSWEFNKDNLMNADGLINKEKYNNGLTIKEIYDDLTVVDYKKLTPQKKLIENDNIEQGASNLTFLKKDEFKYENESINNGGQIKENLYAHDTYNDINYAMV